MLLSLLLLCRPDCTHSDVHASNILRYGLLNHRELSRSKAFRGQKTKEAEMNYQYDRIGTWQFASVHVLVNHSRVPTVSDDLESFFHVMLYLAIRFLPHNAHDCLEELLFYYFDDHTDGKRSNTAGSTKYIAMHDGRIDITRFTGTEPDENGQSTEAFLTFLRPDVDSNPTSEPIEEAGHHPINLVMSELLQWLEALYAQDKKVVAKRPCRKKDRRVLGNLSLALPGMESADNTQSIQSQPTASERFVELEQAKRLVQLELSQKLESHDAMVELLTRCIWDLE